MLNLIPGIQSTSTALNAERIRMDVVSQNISNAQVTKGPDGKPYQRQQVVFQTVLDAQVQGSGGGSGGSMVQVAKIVTDQRPPILAYRPGHPDADARGMVAMPNINVHEEMVDLIASSRSFEANLAVVKSARSMAMQSLSIGKRS